MWKDTTDTMINSIFTVHIHYRKSHKMNQHMDLRVLNPSKTKAYSFALPKARFPEGNEKMLAVRTPDHSVKIMKLEGNLQNGDRLEIYDQGKCKIVMDSDDRKGFVLEGKNIKGFFIFIKRNNYGKSDTWLVFRSNKKV